MVCSLVIGKTLSLRAQRGNLGRGAFGPSRLLRRSAPRNDSESRSHAEFALARQPQFVGEAGEIDGKAARVARVDDLLDPKGLGGAEWRAQLLQPLVDLRNLRVA